MAKKHTKILKLTGKNCRLGKISNNIERHGTQHVTAFAIPVTALMLTKNELNTFLRDPTAHESWFTKPTKADPAIEPRPWWNGETFRHSEEYEADKAMLVLSGGNEVEFESEGDPKEDDYRPAMTISKIKLTPHTGGMTEVSCTIYVRPALGKKNLALQGAQYEEVKLTVSAKVSDRDKNQSQLPLNEGDAEGAAASGDGDEAAAGATAH